MRMTSKRWLLLPTALVALVLVLLLGGGAAEAANNTLKNLMKKMGDAAANEDTKTVGTLLAEAGAMKPADPAFNGWETIVASGKSAADAGNLAGAKLACKDCHRKYRDSYRIKFGSKSP
jgi:hypothetical protein